MATIVITGGTGLVGRALSRELISRGYQVIVLTRHPEKYTDSESLRYASWDIEKNKVDSLAIEKADHIIHLAGAGVADKRWSAARKKEIVDSRVQSSLLLGSTLNEIPNSVKTIVSASAIGWYGPDNVLPDPRPFTEEDIADQSFLGSTCLRWEEAAKSMEKDGRRLVILRTGIVLSADGGALEAFTKPVRLGIAAIMGNGEQVVSWIHITDLVRLYITAIESAEWKGVYNAVAPNPVSNKILMLTLAEKFRGRFFLPLHLPAFVLKMVLGDMSVEVLKSATVSSRKAQLAGFDFQYSTIGKALDSLQNKKY